MNWTLIGMILLIVVLIASPFAALRSVNYLQARREAARAKALPPDDENDPDKPSGFW